MNPLRIRTRWVPMLLNIIGLGIAFSVFLILMSQVWYDYRYDRFEGGKDVYAVEIPSFQEGLYSPQILRPLIQMVADVFIVKFLEYRPQLLADSNENPI